jgi:chromosome partitioning protein
MKTLGVISQKGGSGKTTSAVNLAAYFASQGKTVVLLDTDPQASACEIMEEPADGLVVQDCAPARVGHAIKTAQELGADIVIIDSPPYINNNSLGVAKESDLILVPVSPNRLNLHALKSTVDIVRMAEKPALAVLTMAPTAKASTVADQARTAISEVFQLPLAQAVLHYRLAYQHATTAGKSVVHFAPGSPAASEIKALADELQSLLKF